MEVETPSFMLPSAPVCQRLRSVRLPLLHSMVSFYGCATYNTKYVVVHLFRGRVKSDLFGIFFPIKA